MRNEQKEGQREMLLALQRCFWAAVRRGSQRRRINFMWELLLIIRVIPI